MAESSYHDAFEDYVAFIEPRLRAAHRLLTRTGTFYFHIDYREAHYCKLLLDEVFGRESSSTKSSGHTTTAPARGALAGKARHDSSTSRIQTGRYYFDSE